MEAFEKVYEEVRAQLKKARKDNKIEEARDYEEMRCTLDDYKPSFLHKQQSNIAKLTRKVNENYNSTPFQVPSLPAPKNLFVFSIKAPYAKADIVNEFNRHNVFDFELKSVQWLKHGRAANILCKNLNTSCKLQCLSIC